MTDIISELGMTREEFERFQPYDYLVRNAKKIPNEIAVTDGESTLTWKELFEITKRIARELRERGVQPGDIVATRLPPILSVFFAWAIFHEAAVFLPYFDGIEETPDLRFRFIVSNSPMDVADPSRLILVDDAWFEKIHMNSIIIDQRQYPTPDSISRYVTSSGTTGRPKLMPFSWTASVQRAIDSHNRSRSKTVVLTTFSIRAETGWHNAFGAALLQRPHLIARDAVSYVELMKRFQVDVFRASPVHLSEFADALEATGVRLPDLALIIPVGGRLPHNVSEALQRLTSAQIGNGYGATEVGPMSMRYTTSSDHSDAGGIDPITEVQIVDDDTHQVLPDGEVGLVRARTQHMVHEYPGNPEATERHFRDGWFYPGDYGRLVENNLFLEGRSDELINQGGTKIDPVLIEEAFADIPEILECAAFGLVDESGISRISIAYVADRKLDGEWLRAQVEPRLGRRTPRNFFRVSEIPLGETGKPLRRELVNLVNAATNASGSSTSSQTAETALVLPWPLDGAEVLQPFDYVAKHAAERPFEVALTDGESTLTWKELFDLSTTIASELRARGVRPGDRVGVLLPSFTTVVVMWSVFHEAAVFSPLAPNMGAENPLGFTLVVSNRPLPDWPAEKILLVDFDWIQDKLRNPVVVEQLRYPSLDAELHLSLTSGSTGTPKALSFSISESTTRTIESFRWTAAKSKGMSFLPPRSQGWYHFYYNGLLGTPYLVASEPRLSLELIRRFNVDVIRASPAQLAELVEELDRTGRSFPPLTLILSSGGQLPEPLRHSLKRLSNAPIGNAYGATEVGGVSMRRSDSDDSTDTGLIFPGVDVEILDESTMEPLPEGKTGLVRLRGAVTCTEFLNNPEATHKHFRDGWFYPGDLGRIERGRLFILGRQSELINSGGSTIDPVVVEQAFDGVGGILDCAAFEISDHQGIRRLGLAYVADSDIDVEAVRRAVQPILLSATPVSFFRVPAIPRSDTGKTQRAQLSAYFDAPSNVSQPVSTTSAARFVQPFDYVRRGWRENPDAPALIHATGTVTRKEIAILAKQYAMFLRDRGVRPGDTVMIQLDVISQLVFTLAVFHEAAVVAPFIPEVIRDHTLDVDWVISKERVADVAETKNIVVNDEAMVAIARNTEMLPARTYPGPDALMRIAFSSGTTGTPKPIPFTVTQTAERSLDHESRTLSERQFMCMMPPVRGMGWWSWYASVIDQRPYIIPSNTHNNITMIGRHRVDSIVASPAQIADMMRLLEQSQTKLPDLKTIQVGGSNVSAAIVAQIKKLTNARVINIYGSTEVGPTTMRRDDNDDPSYVGEVLPGLSVEIVDPVSHSPLPDGEIGLVRARSETMSHEYLGNPAATAESWKDGWFYSGDLGRLESNKLFLAGRTSEVINDGGGKIDPIIIDAHFDDEPAFDDHAAFAVHMPNGLDRVGLAYVARGDVDLSPVMKRADDALKFHAPAVYMPVSEIPRNELGKPMRNQLTQQFAETNSHEG